MASKPMEGSSVLACLQELWPDFQLTMADQMNPTSEIAIKFYERFICGQLQIEIGELERMLIEKCSCGDAFADILTIYSLYMCTATIIQKLGLNELFQTFGLTDLLRPMRKKFKMSLILLSNCVIYVASLQEFMEEVKNKVFEGMQTFKSSQNKIDELKGQKNNAVILHVKNAQKIEDLQKHKESLLKQIQSAQEELERATDEANHHERELHQEQDEYEIFYAKFNDLLKVEEKLKGEIVDNHQSIAYEKDRLIKERNELLVECDEIEAIMNQKMQTISCYQENLACTNQFLETIPLSKLLKKYEILHKYNTERKELHDKMKSLQDTENLYLATLKQFEVMNDSMERKIQDSIIKYENKMGKLDKKINELQNEIKVEHDKVAESTEFYQQLENQLQKMKESSQQYEDLIEKQNIYYDEKYRQILELKGYLDNKVMALVNRLEEVLMQNKK